MVQYEAERQKLHGGDNHIDCRAVSMGGVFGAITTTERKGLRTTIERVRERIAKNGETAARNRTGIASNNRMYWPWDEISLYKCG